MDLNHADLAPTRPYFVGINLLNRVALNTEPINHASSNNALNSASNNTYSALECNLVRANHNVVNNGTIICNLLRQGNETYNFVQHDSTNHYVTNRRNLNSDSINLNSTIHDFFNYNAFCDSTMHGAQASHNARPIIYYTAN